MKTNFLKYIALIGFVGILYSCEKDEDKAFMKENPTAPSIVTMPDMTLLRDNGTDILEFICTPVDPGFNASARYFLEVDAADANFAAPLVLFNGVDASVISMTTAELNSLLLRKFPADETSAAEFRLRSTLVVDAGTGAPGTGIQPFQYTSAVKPVQISIYGLPRLDLLGSGVDQKIESALGDGAYTGYVKLTADVPFTLIDPDTEKVYGGSAGTLNEDGAGITVSNSGWYLFSADINAMTFTIEDYMIGIIGTATPNDWNSPDTKLDYDSQSGTWYITLNLKDGLFKFRKNDAWGAGVNFGGFEGVTPVVEVSSPDEALKVNELFNAGSSQDLPITAGNYSIVLTINSDGTGSFTIVLNGPSVEG